LNPTDNSRGKRRLSYNSFKIIWALLVLVLLLFFVGIASIRFYLIPNIDNHREWISDRLSASMEQTVRLGSIKAHWDGLHPDLIFSDVDISDNQGNSVFGLDRLEVQISTIALFFGHVDLLKIELSSPSLAIRRDKDNAIWISGRQIFPSSQDHDGPLLKWLARQKHVEMSGGVLTFTDELSNNHSMTFNDVLLTAKFTGNDASIVLSSEAQNSWYQAITLSIDDSNILELTDGVAFKGKVAWEISALQMSPFETWLPPELLVTESVLTSRGLANIDGLESQQLAMDLRLDDFSVNRPGDVSPLGVSQTSFQVSLDSSKEKHAITFSNVFALFDGGLSTHLDVVRMERDLVLGKNQVVTRDLSLDLVKLIGRQTLENPKYLSLMERLLPGGTLNLIDISWFADNGVFPIGDVSVQARFENAGLYASGKNPGVQGLTGAVKYSKEQFLIDIDSYDITLDASAFFSQPLYFSEFKSMFTGKKISGLWEIDMTGVAFSNADLAGTAAARVVILEEFEKSMLDLQVKVDQVELNRLPFYLPSRLKKTKSWFQNRVDSGTAEKIIVTARGEMASSFFTRNGADFEVSAEVKSGRVEIAGGWPSVDDIDGRFRYKNHQVVFAPTAAQIFGVNVSDSELKIDKTGTPETTLTLNGTALAPISDLIRYVNESPLSKATKGGLKNMVSDGVGKLALRLKVPLLNRKDTQVDGSINLTASSLRVTELAPEFKDFEALVEFTKGAVMIRNGKALIFEGPVSFASQRVDRGLGRIKFEADVYAGAFMDYLSLPVELSGKIGSSGVLEFRPNELSMDFNVELERVASKLPRPLDGFVGNGQPLKVAYVSKKSGAREVTFTYGNAKVGNLVFFNRNLVRGTLNSAKVVDDGFFLIGGEISHLDLDGWRDFVDKRKKEDLSNTFPLTVLVDTHVRRVDAFGNTFDDVEVNGQFLKSDGLFNIDSTKIAGKIAFSDYGNDEAKVSAHLTRLAVRRSARKEVSGTNKAAELNRPLLAIDAVIDKFELDDIGRGAVTFRAIPNNGRWDIKELSTITDVGTLTMRGNWRPGLEPRVEYYVEFNVEDVGQYLFSLDGAEHMHGGAGTLSGSVSWRGSPFVLDLKTLDGALNLEVKDGRFLKINPGAGHIISLLSLQALPRRITLDFRDVFSSGFSFDYITSEIIVTRGVARTDKLLMDGTSASVAITGSADLVQKEQELEVFVTPKISGAASVAGAVAANPAIGLAAFLAQKLLGNPFDRIATRHYIVKGNWSDPDVVRVQRGSLQ